MILDLIRDAGAWSWVILGVVLFALEVIIPGAFLLWFGLAAGIVGVLALLFAMSWQAQGLLFVVLAVAMVFVGRRYFARGKGSEVSTGLNERGRRLVGQTVMLHEPIVDGQGRIRIDDTTWRVTGPNLPSGTLVRIVNTEGALLSVERAGEAS